MPNAEYDSGLVTIIDDFGGKVKLTIAELTYVAGKLRNFVELAKEDLIKQQLATQAEIEDAKKSKGV